MPARERIQAPDLPLYRSDAEIAEALGVPERCWQIMTRTLPIPAHDPLAGEKPKRRYWPAVKQVFDARHKVNGSSYDNLPGKPDAGEEGEKF